jgi:hypothetical protein
MARPRFTDAADSLQICRTAADVGYRLSSRRQPTRDGPPAGWKDYELVVEISMLQNVIQCIGFRSEDLRLGERTLQEGIVCPADRRCICPQRWYLHTSLHGATTQKTTVMFTAVRFSNLTLYHTLSTITPQFQRASDHN